MILNGIHLTASEDEYYELVISVAEGQKEKSHIAEFFRDHSETTS